MKFIQKPIETKKDAIKTIKLMAKEKEAYEYIVICPLKNYFKKSSSLCS